MLDVFLLAMSLHSIWQAGLQWFKAMRDVLTLRPRHVNELMRNPEHLLLINLLR